MVDSNYNNTEVPADLPEEQASQSSVRVVAARSKAKAKPQKRETAQLPSTIPMNERKWIDIEPAESSLSAYEVSKKVVNLLRHCQTIQREDDGAVQFWRIKFYFRNQCPQNQYWSDDRWKICLAAGGGPKRRYQYCSDISGTIVYLRALQGHSGRSLIDLSLQDKVIIQCGLLHHIYHIGCTFNLHSIINNGLIPGGQDSSKRDKQYSSCMLIPETKGIKILHILTSLCHVAHNTCTVLGRNTKTLYFGLILILRFEND